ncbi:MAG: hypothetical protein WEB04_01160 [Dehalococcoidia bacterium]
MPIRCSIGLKAVAAAVVVSAVFAAGVGTMARADAPTPTPQAEFMTDEEVGEYKATHDPAPPPTPSQELLDRIAAKEATVKEWYAAHPDKVPGSEQASDASVQSFSSCADYDGNGVVDLFNDIFYVAFSFGMIDGTADLDNSGGVVDLFNDIFIAAPQFGSGCYRSGVTSIGRLYQGQWNSYYCGPAAVAEALAIKPGRFGVVDQGAAAWLLNTDPDGTDWYGGPARVPLAYNTGYPVRDVLNYEIGTAWYVPHALPYSPSSDDISTYVNSMVANINQRWPVLGDAWEASFGSHLRGHPLSQEIFHWFTISGYEDGGDTTNYMDSATTVWAAVQGWNTLFPSSTLVTILGGRGYVW